MNEIMMRDIGSVTRLPIVSLDDMITVGDARKSADGTVTVANVGGIRTGLFRNSSAEAAVSIRCKTKKPLTLRIGYVNSNGESTFEGIHAITVVPGDGDIAELNKIFDAANLIVYYDAVSFFVQIDCAEANVFCIESGLVWEHNELERMDIYAENLEEMMKNIERKFEEEAFETANNTENIVVSPSGRKFVLNVDDDGNLSTTSLIPQKVLFIGNSLLFGMGGYGMCASSPRNDYYYYVSEAIRQKNPDVCFYKMRGARYEQLEDPAEFEILWNVGSNDGSRQPMKAGFADDLDLILIQLGTNVNNVQRGITLAQTIDTFISRIKECCPKARIVWIHGWDNEYISGKVIVDACRRWRVGQICIKDLNTKENRGQLKQEYELSNGEKAIVNEYWIGHPGDVGMKRIAGRIISYLKL